MNLLLRQATLADVNAIAKVYLTSRRKFIAFAPLVHSEKAVYRWIANTLLSSTQVFVAQIEEVVVGMMAISVNKGSWIEQLYILPEFVAQGIGRLLIEKAKSILPPPIRLHTFQENWGARRFYEQQGFEIIEFTDGSNNEEKCPDILYEWKI